MATGPFTIEDFERLPDELAENHELVDGELIDVSGNTAIHILFRDLLGAVLRPFVRQRKLGQVFTGLDYDFEGNAHGPDVSFISSRKLASLKCESVFSVLCRIWRSRSPRNAG